MHVIIWIHSTCDLSAGDIFYLLFIKVYWLHKILLQILKFKKIKRTIFTGFKTVLIDVVELEMKLFHYCNTLFGFAAVLIQTTLVSIMQR